MTFDLLILSNGPGEVSTWVRPVVQRLRERYGSEVRVSLVLSPCPHATGQELTIAQRFPGIDRFQAAEYFFPFLLWGQTHDRWDWHDRGVVIFLGGDQFFAVCLGKRLGYGIVVYAEWEARWLPWVDRFGVMSPKVLQSIPARYRSKVTIVGDLMADAALSAPALREESAGIETPETIALLPGSKAAKLGLGVPFVLAIADYVQHHRPHCRFWIPVAPTLTPETLASYAQADKNPLIPLIKGTTAHLISDGSIFYLQTAAGVRVELADAFPLYDRLRSSLLAITTVGANTAELGALGVPMIVLLPTQHLAVMRSWDGLPGLVARIPVLGDALAASITTRMLQRKGLLAWPNLWAGKTIVPELVGDLTPSLVGDQILDYLNHPEKLQTMQQDLRQARGTAGAAEQLVNLIYTLERERLSTQSEKV